MGKVYASFDWHGCGKVAQQVLDFLNPDDTLYYGGDVIDRGPDGLMLFDKLIERPNTIFIKGNHEAMMANSIPAISKDIKNHQCFYDIWNYNLWFRNGGYETAKPFLKMTAQEILKYKNIIDKMPTEVRYESPKGHTVILEHSGYTPFDIPHRSHDPLWDREHFYDKWREGHDDTYLVHGHTPVQYLRLMYGYDGMEPLTAHERKHKLTWHLEKNLIIPEVIRYCSGHKFDIDMCTIVSRRIALLDLDTFETIYFDEEEN
jgi:serine/threonine protein phosphatase 1